MRHKQRIVNNTAIKERPLLPDFGGQENRLAEDILTHYLAGVADYKLLSPADELRLAQAVQDGQNASEELNRLQPQSKRERARLARLVAEGEQAREQFILANLRLVLSTARKYYSESPGIDFMDLVQEGNLGLMRAVDKYDWKLGFKFSTYATNWIRAYISRFLAERSDLIRIPIGVHQTRNAVSAAELDLEARLHRRPDAQEIANEIGVTAERVTLVQGLSPTSSLNTPVGDGGIERGELIRDPNLKPMEEVVEALEQSRTIAAALASLTSEEALTLKLRYGLFDGVTMGTEAIAQELGVSRARVTQLERRGIAKLQDPNIGLRAFGLDRSRS